MCGTEDEGTVLPVGNWAGSMHATECANKCIVVGAEEHWKGCCEEDDDGKCCAQMMEKCVVRRVRGRRMMMEEKSCTSTAASHHYCCKGHRTLLR